MRNKKKPLQDRKGNPLQYNRIKFEQYITKTKQAANVENLADQIAPSTIIDYVNLARTKPKQFAALLKSRLKSYKGDKLVQTPHLQISCIQGKSAINQAIRFCQSQKPVHALIPSQALMLSAFDHCMDMIRNQYLGHDGTDGSVFWERISRRGQYMGGGGQNCDQLMWFQDTNYAQCTIVRLIVDEGVPSRGHRTNLFNPAYKYIGVCMLKDPKNGYKHAMNLTMSEVILQNSSFSQRNFNYRKAKDNPKQQKTQQKKQTNKYEKKQSDYDYDIKKQKFNKKEEQEQIYDKKQKIIENKPKKVVKKVQVSPIQAYLNQIEQNYPPITEINTMARYGREWVRKIRRKFQLYVSSTAPQPTLSTFPDEIEAQQIIQVVNKARTSPKQFIQVLKSKMKELTSQKNRKTPYGTYTYQQGKPAFQQAIQFLQTQKPLPPLQLNRCLCLVASDHCIDMIGNNFFNNRSSDASSLQSKIKKRYGDKFIGNVAENWDIVDWKLGPHFAEETVIRYVISEKITNRAFRVNLFNKLSKYVGVSMLKDPKEGYKTNIIFSNDNYTVFNNDATDKNYLYYGSKTLEKALKLQQSSKKAGNQKEKKENFHSNFDEIKQFQDSIQKQKQKIQNPEFKINNGKHRQQDNSQKKPKIQKLSNDAEYNRLRDKQDEEIKKMWGDMKSNSNTVSMKNNLNIGSEDIFSQNLSSNLSSTGKQLQQTYTKTKTITVNGIKKTQIKKIVMYTDGTSQTFTKVV